MAPKRFTVSKVTDPTMYHDTSVSMALTLDILDFEAWDDYYSEILSDMFDKEPMCVQHCMSYTADEKQAQMIEGFVSGKDWLKSFEDWGPHIEKVVGKMLVPTRCQLQGPPGDIEEIKKVMDETPFKDICVYFESDTRGFRRKNAHEIMRAKMH